MTISCYHHQGLGRLGDGLRASAYAEDGTIEAVALDDHDGWYLGVQWHPEDTAATDAAAGGCLRGVRRDGGSSGRVLFGGSASDPDASMDVTIVAQALGHRLLRVGEMPRTTRDSIALNFG